MPSILNAHIPTIYCFPVYLFQLMPIISTYMLIVRICFTTLKDRVGSGYRVQSHRVGSQVKNPDPVPSLAQFFFFLWPITFEHDLVACETTCHIYINDHLVQKVKKANTHFTVPRKVEGCWPRHWSKGVHPVPKAAYSSGCRYKNNCMWLDSNMGPLLLLPHLLTLSTHRCHYQ